MLKPALQQQDAVRQFTFKQEPHLSSDHYAAPKGFAYSLSLRVQQRDRAHFPQEQQRRMQKHFDCSEVGIVS